MGVRPPIDPALKPSLTSTAIRVQTLRAGYYGPAFVSIPVDLFYATQAQGRSALELTDQAAKPARLLCHLDRDAGRLMRMVLLMPDQFAQRVHRLADFLAGHALLLNRSEYGS